MNRMMASPRRPIILKRRKRPFQRNEADETQNKSSTASGARSVSASAQDSIRVVDHPTRPKALVVVVPETAGLQSVLDALTAKREESGTLGPNKFIFLSGRCGSEDEVKALFQATSENKNLLRPEAGVAGNDQTLPNSGCACKEKFDGCVQLQEPQHTEEEPSAVKGPLSERPPYSYMAMIQFAINSKKNKMMTLKEIYNWIEDHFPYFRNVAKPGWKNAIRHNLSLNDMFIRERADGKISYWTIKPEANRGLTLDQVYKPAVDPAASSFPQAMQVCYQQVPKNESSVVVMSAPVAEVEEERVCIPQRTPQCVYVSEPCSSKQKEILRKRYERISRRKQRLIPLFDEEPVLLFDSSLVSTFQEMECDLEPRQDLQLQRETFKTPDKGSHPFSSTPSNSPEPWKITPLDKGNRGVMDFSPIRTSPQRHEHSELFRDLPLFGSPRELLASCSHEQQTESSNHSLTEDFVLDTMNDSLSKILMDISFTGLEDDDLDIANLSWSQFIPELELDVSL